MPTLTWIGKDKVVNHHHDVPYSVLEKKQTFIAPAGSPENSTDNRIIHGDNLEVLKSLLPEFEGRVNCIYIDPPYNTGNEGWVYNDNVNDPRVKKWLGDVVGKEGEDLTRHDKWLCMMYPRLKLLHRLLAEDGVIFISIDDNEQANLKLICDEVFGSKNYINNIVWQKKHAAKSDSKYLSESHDHLLVFAKYKDKVTINRLSRTEQQDARYKNPDGDTRGVWTSGDLLRNEARDYAIYPIESPSGRIHQPPNGTSWRFTQDRFLELVADNRIWFGAKGDNVPRLKRFLSEVSDSVPATTWWEHKDVGHNDEAKKELRSLLEVVFRTLCQELHSTDSEDITSWPHSTLTTHSSNCNQASR